jgi:hypothetical protein
MYMKPKAKSNLFISLQDASKHCEYSSEYLRLRARQGKLQAKKIGKSWFTTHEWLHEYVKNANEYKEHVLGKDIQGQGLYNAQKHHIISRLPQAPVNLPIQGSEGGVADRLSRISVSFGYKKETSVKTYAFFCTSFALVLMFLWFTLAVSSENSGRYISNRDISIENEHDFKLIARWYTAWAENVWFER